MPSVMWMLKIWFVLYLLILCCLVVYIAWDILWMLGVNHSYIQLNINIKILLIFSLCYFFWFAWAEYNKIDHIFVVYIYLLFQSFFLFVLFHSTQDGDTGLICACENGHIDIVRALIDAKCDVNALNEVWWVICVVWNTVH